MFLGVLSYILMITHRYEYKTYERVENNGVRFYSINDQLLPSVTTILSATQDSEKVKTLAKWRDDIGHDCADRIVNQSTELGTNVHKNIEDWAKYDKPCSGNILERMMSTLIIKCGFKKIDEYWGFESCLYSQNLYAGTADFVGVFEGEPIIGDFKTSRSEKTYDQIDDYKCQLAAYSAAHNEMFNTKIRKGVIMLVTHNGSYFEYVVEGNEYKKQIDKWYNRLEYYYTNIFFNQPK